MSAIWGFVNIDGKDASEVLGKDMMRAFEIYKIDNYKYLKRKNIFIGCGLQYITQESLSEVLPFYDKENGLMITADAIIDNREELMKYFGCSEKVVGEFSDSQYILMAYKKWGRECTKYLIGDFSFVIWDENKEEIFCAVDHVGTRILYYYYDQKKFAFSTTIKPLTYIDDKKSFNERWMAEYLGLDWVVSQTNYNETIYDDIKQIPPGSSIVINKNGIKIIDYWNPYQDIKPLRLTSYNEYIEMFNKIFYEVIKCRLRSSDSVGIMLSGGLDSGAISCVAAKILSKENKVLKSFSSIPYKDVEGSTNDYRIADESEYIESILKENSNIEQCYCKCEEKHAVTDVDNIIKILEQPYKMFQNIHWYKDIIEKAGDDNCKVLLNGQFGNSTISYGNYFTEIMTLAKTFRWITLAKEVRRYYKFNNLPRKLVVKKSIEVLTPYKIKKIIYSKKNSENNRDNFAIKDELYDKWEIGKLTEKLFGNGVNRVLEWDKVKELIVNKTSMSHIGTIETKFTLANGIVMRDPTRDKRVIEFCLSLPIEAFSYEGEERRLIREAMTGILPEKIRVNTRKRGLQGADWVKRINKEISSICEELEILLKDEILKKYIDVDRANLMISDIKEENANEVKRLLTVFVFCKFIILFKKQSHI